MRCDPQILNLKGFQSEGRARTIEYGNHLRAFIGSDNGAPETQLRYYRRNHREKELKSFFKSFKIPIEKSKLSEGTMQGVEIPIKIETNDPLLTLNATIHLDLEQITMRIKFPSLIGYLEIESFRTPILIPIQKR